MELALEGYAELITAFQGTAEYKTVIRELCKQDRFFLLTHMLHRPDAVHPFLYARCREVEKDPDNHLDLWARYHYKSTIITFAGIVQEVIRNPEITICILSYNNKVASSFMGQLKREFEGNTELIRTFDDIFWENPKRDAPTWSMESGLIVQRTTNPASATVEAYGLVDNQPVGKHYMLRVYDDVVTKESVSTPEMVAKVTDSWELSLSLGAGKQGNRQWYVGTRYNADDTYQEIINRDILTQRIYPATDDGTLDGEPVFMDREEWDLLVKSTSEYTLSCQQLLDPLSGSQRELKDEWVRRWEVRPYTLNVYILVDPASSKKSKKACNTAMVVIGVDAHLNKYLLDGMCHQMNLAERWTNLKKLRTRWLNAPGIQFVEVGYEKYGMQADIEHYKEMMRIEKKSFDIKEVAWVRDGLQAKNDRIRRLIPDHKNSRFYYPEISKRTGDMVEAEKRGLATLVAKPIKRIDHNGRVYELTEWFLKNEYSRFPNSQKKDMLDACSRVYDMEINPPILYDEDDTIPNDFSTDGPSYHNGEMMEPEVV